MWRKSASFVMENVLEQQKDIRKAAGMEGEMNKYYDTRAGHHSAVTPDWLAQAQAALPHGNSEEHYRAPHDETAKSFDVIAEFNHWRKKPHLAEAVAAIMALAAVIKRSQALTMMELEIELKNASDTLKLWDETSISLSAGCDLFMRYVTRTSALEYEDFHTAKSRLIERGERFGEISLKARKTIAMLGQDFIVDGSRILVHGFSRVVLALLKMASSNGKHFSVFCTEGRPDNTGIEMTKELVAVGVPVKLIIDSAVAYTMEKVDLVLFGADGVVESGGILNMMGTYQTALVAHSLNKPVYVAAESYKVAETRFASHTIVLRRLVKVKEALSLMVISNQWSIWKQSNTTRAQKVKAMILDDDWWVRVEYVLEFTEPIMSMLRFADTDEPCLGDVYDSMDTMLEEIKAVIQRRENDPRDTFYKRVEATVHHRWNKMTTPLHLLAYALSPRYYSQSMLRLPGRVAPFRDSEVSKGALGALSKIFQDPEIGDIVRDELGSFVSGKDFGSAAVNDQRKMDAIKWWYLHGQDYRYLQPLAIKILSQVASSSAAERNWSTYSFIHSVKRNRLAAKKAEDLVFVHNNLRLVARKDPKYKKGPEKLWDVAPENADLDMTIQDLARSTLANLDDDDDDETHTIPSSASGTVFGSSESSDQPLAAVGDPIDTDFFDNPFDD